MSYPPLFDIPKVLHKTDRYVPGEIWITYGIPLKNETIIQKEQKVMFESTWDISDKTVQTLVSCLHEVYNCPVHHWRTNTHTGVLISNFLYMSTSQTVGVLYVEYRILYPKHNGGEADTQFKKLSELIQSKL
jgi:hypothetical protein